MARPLCRRRRGRPCATAPPARIDGIGQIITGDRTGQSRRRGRGEGLGWEYLHVAIDDASRLAYTALMPDEKQESAVRFLEDALDWFGAHGLGVECVMTDNSSAFKSKLFAAALQSRGLKHKRTRPYTPRTNGKAERFIQTSRREWAYAMPFQSSAERARAMPPGSATTTASGPTPPSAESRPSPDWPGTTSLATTASESFHQILTIGSTL